MDATDDRARLLDLAERPRANDWSLRSALTRYAQTRPALVAALLEQLRRIEAALAPHRRPLLAGDPPADEQVAGMLGCLEELDRLGDQLAVWAGEPWGPPGTPIDDQIREVGASVARRLEELQVPHEERRPPGRGARGTDRS